MKKALKIIGLIILAIIVLSAILRPSDVKEGFSAGYEAARDQ